jgi:hypothetical protein
MSEPLKGSVSLLLQLHQMELDGQDESPEADAIRDRMNAHWYAMTYAQQTLFSALSAALNREAGHV